MKKYLMFILTLAVLSATVLTQISANQGFAEPNWREPFLDLTSPKFGQIKNIVWLDDFILTDNAVLVLATKPKDNLSYSYLSYLDVATGESTLLAEFPAHQYLDDVILSTNPFSGKSVITAYNAGIVRTTLSRDDQQHVHAEQEFLPIAGFAEANSMDFPGNLYYSRANDNLH